VMVSPGRSPRWKLLDLDAARLEDIENRFLLRRVAQID